MTDTRTRTHAHKHTHTNTYTHTQPHRLMSVSQRSGGVVRVACTTDTNMKRMHKSRSGHDCSTHLYKGMHADMHTYLHTCTHTYVHACIHTSIHTKRTRAPVSDVLQTPVCPDLSVGADIFACAYVHKTHLCMYGILQTPVLYSSKWCTVEFVGCCPESQASKAPITLQFYTHLRCV